MFSEDSPHAKNKKIIFFLFLKLLVGAPCLLFIVLYNVTGLMFPVEERGETKDG